MMLDVVRNTVATWSQYSRNMVTAWEEEGGGPLIFGCCMQPTRNIARNVLATFAPWL
jgi:hypothetical protein